MKKDNTTLYNISIYISIILLPIIILIILPIYTLYALTTTELEFRTVEKLDDKYTEQELTYIQDKKYKYIPKYDCDDGFTCEFHEYSTPTGEKGYQIIMEDQTTISTLATGPEATARTYVITKTRDTDLINVIEKKEN